MKKIKRMLSVVLAAAMVLSLMCSAVSAAPAEETSPTKVTLNKSTIYVAVGETVQLTAKVSNSQGVVWSSIRKSVAEVDSTGAVTGVTEGKSVIKAASEDGKAYAECKVVVYMAFPSYSLRQGGSVQLSADVPHADWTSSNPDVATVSSSGTVKGVSFGRAYITASEPGSSGRSQSFSITVGAHVGIDISSWNNKIDWQKLKEQGIEFVIIRAGYGWEHTDKRFQENIEGAIANDMPFGIYFYSYAKDASKARVEANYCVKLLEPYREHVILPVAYDLEEYHEMTGKTLTDAAEVFCGILQDAGYHTMVYSNSQFLSKMDLSYLKDRGVDAWYARFPVVPAFNSVEMIPKQTVKPIIWQYSDAGVVQGALASERTDMNVMYMPEYLDLEAPAVRASASGSKAEISWGGSTYASSYTVYRHVGGREEKVGSFSGTVHHCTDSKYTDGASYSVRMEVRDPLAPSAYQKVLTSKAVKPAVVRNYKVTVTAGEGGTVSGGGTFLEGKSVTVKASAKEGYAFKGWNDAAGKLVSDKADYTFTVKADTTLKAVFTKVEIVSHKVTVTAGEGGSVTGGGTFQEGRNATVKAAAREGYAFKGWFDASGKLVSDKAEYTFAVKADTALKAEFTKAVTHKVTVTAGKGGTVSGGGTVESGKNVTVKAVPAQGYVFKGWFDAGGKLVSDKAEYTFAVKADTTLKAEFTESEKPNPSGFTDVKPGDWYEEAVGFVVQQGLFKGISETEFAPMGAMDRSMLVTVLYRQAGSPEASNRNKFVDVSKDAWYARAVTWAYNNGIVKGTGPKNFSPTAKVTREQIATILQRYSEVMGVEVPETTDGDLSAFKDSVEISSFAKEGMRWAIATQIMEGSNQKLMPKKEASRAECATILMRWMETDQGE